MALILASCLGEELRVQDSQEAQIRDEEEGESAQRGPDVDLTRAGKEDRKPERDLGPRRSRGRLDSHGSRDDREGEDTKSG
jgi:hypothetical protein